MLRLKGSKTTKSGLPHYVYEEGKVLGNAETREREHAIRQEVTV